MFLGDRAHGITGWATSLVPFSLFVAEAARTRRRVPLQNQNRELEALVFSLKLFSGLLARDRFYGLELELEGKRLDLD